MSQYYLASSEEMDKRKDIAEEFYNAVLDPEEIPYIVTDEAALYDFFAGDEMEVIKKIRLYYKINIDIQHFKIPFWKLLDFLQENRH